MRRRSKRCKKNITTLVNRLVNAIQSLQNGLYFWGRNLHSEDEHKKRRSQMDSAKTFLESLQAYTSPGKIKNFRYNELEINSHRDELLVLKEFESLQELVIDIGSIASYISTAEAILDAEHEWIKKMQTTRDEVIVLIVDPINRSKTSFRQETQRKLSDLKKDYLQTYLGLHTKARLGVNEDKRKSQILKDNRLKVLQSLSTIDLMPRQQLTDFQNRLTGLKSCFALI